MNYKTIISPSILAADFLNLEFELKQLESIDNLWLHLDIMDGHFVPNLTFGHPIVELIGKRNRFILDAHLMVQNPEFYVDTFVNYGIHHLTFHLESSHFNEKILLKAKKMYPSVGVSIRPSTDLSKVSDSILKSINLFLLMSVEPGFAGQKFIETTWERLEQLVNRRKKLGLDFHVQIDGGVSDKNISRLKSLGANNFVVGSYLFKKKGMYKEAIKALLN